MKRRDRPVAAKILAMKSLDPRVRPPHARPLFPLLALGLGALLGSCSSEAQPTGDEKLVVLVIVDTLRQDALGCYGREGAQTPRIDALAAEGARFDQGISSSGWTLPSVASLLTGTWPMMHKALGKATRLTPITEDLPVAGEVFQEAGYETLGFANAAFLSPLLGLGRGFDVFDHEHAYNQEIRRADATVDAALSALSERKADDVFLMLHLFDAHLDYDPPDGYIDGFVGERRKPAPPLSMRECLGLRRDEGASPPSAEDLRYIRGLYQGEVSFVDQQIGRFVDGLKELGRWKNTTLVLTADHGEEFWDHEGFEHGHTLYHELVRVPLIVRTPPSAGANTHEVDRIVRTIDIMPTLFELHDIEPPRSFEGKSFLGDLRGQTPRRVPPAFSQGTLYGAEKISWRTQTHCLIVDQAKKPPEGMELYDLVADPYETQDVFQTQTKVAQELVQELVRFTRDLGQRAGTISTPEIKDMAPSTIKKYMESIESLGYAGREDEEED